MANPQLENGYLKISNEIMEALARIRISGEARQMLDVIIRKTYGYEKKVDRISTSQFCQSTGLKPFIIHRARKNLLKMNIITISKNANGVSKFDYGYGLSYSFQKDYEKWIPISKNAHCAKMLTGGKQKCSQRVTNIDVHNIKKDNIQKKRESRSVPNASLETVFKYWNETSSPKVHKLSKGRESKLRGLLTVGLFNDKWKEVIDRINASEFLTGNNDRSWRADFDWLISNDTNYLKILEGKYDSKKQSWFKPRTGGILQPVQEDAPLLQTERDGSALPKGSDTDHGV